jgi:AraC-like DNA-binding protein
VRLGPVGVFTVSGTPQIVQRTTSAARRSPGDLIKVCVQLSGRATVQQGGHEVGLGPGELAVYDTGRPYQIRFDGAWTCAVMALPRDAIGLPASDLDRWMHRVYPATHGPGSVLSHFVVSTVAETGHPGPAAAAKLGEAGSTLLAGTLLDDGDLAHADAADDMRAHIVRYVRAHLSDPGLARSSIAAAHHMSARTLDRLFADQPRSVSGLIRHERLEAVRRDLRTRPCATVAWRHWPHAGVSSTRLTSAACSGSTTATRPPPAGASGFNASGVGRELGRQGLHEFTETHVMAVPSDG